jgi:hypothetical protein
VLVSITLCVLSVAVFFNTLTLLLATRVIRRFGSERPRASIVMRSMGMWDVPTSGLSRAAGSVATSSPKPPGTL